MATGFDEKRAERSQVYWNLDGWQNPDTPLVLNHTLHMPYAGLRIGTDSILIPTGDILANQPGSVNNFWSAPKQIGANFTSPEIFGNCGHNCTGYGLSPSLPNDMPHTDSHDISDTCYIQTLPTPLTPSTYLTNPPLAILSSLYSGISVSIYTSQPAMQVYTCGGQNGSLPLKTTQGLHGVEDRPRTVQQYGCVVLEVEDWIDGINQVEWGRESEQIFGPLDGPYVLGARYVFEVGRKGCV